MAASFFLADIADNPPPLLPLVLRGTGIVRHGAVLFLEARNARCLRMRAAPGSSSHGVELHRSEALKRHKRPAAPQMVCTSMYLLASFGVFVSPVLFCFVLTVFDTCLFPVMGEKEPRKRRKWQTRRPFARQPTEKSSLPSHPCCSAHGIQLG